MVIDNCWKNIYALYLFTKFKFTKFIFMAHCNLESLHHLIHTWLCLWITFDDGACSAKAHLLPLCQTSYGSVSKSRKDEKKWQAALTRSTRQQNLWSGSPEVLLVTLVAYWVTRRDESTGCLSSWVVGAKSLHRLFNQFNSYFWLQLEKHANKMYKWESWSQWSRNLLTYTWAWQFWNTIKSWWFLGGLKVPFWI